MKHVQLASGMWIGVNFNKSFIVTTRESPEPICIFALNWAVWTHRQSKYDMIATKCVVLWCRNRSTGDNKWINNLHTTSQQVHTHTFVPAFSGTPCTLKKKLFLLSPGIQRRPISCSSIRVTQRFMFLGVSFIGQPVDEVLKWLMKSKKRLKVQRQTKNEQTLWSWNKIYGFNTWPNLTGVLKLK